MIVDHAEHGGGVNGLESEVPMGAYQADLQVGGSAMMPGILSPDAMAVLFERAGITVSAPDLTGPGPQAPERMIYDYDHRPPTPMYID
jgi:hypothetical protein